MDTKNLTNDSSTVESDSALQSRRTFLKKAGRIAAYAPPAIMLLTKPSHASVVTSYQGRPWSISTRDRD